MLGNDSERSHPTPIVSGCVTHEEEPNVILIVNEGFTIVTLAKQSGLIRSISFRRATEVTLLVVDELAGLQDRAPC